MKSYSKLLLKGFLDAFSKAESISITRSVRRSVAWSVGRSLGPSPLNVFHYYASTIGRIGTKIGVEVDINDGYTLT